MSNMREDDVSNSGWHPAFAPATVANVGPGFDVLGLALAESVGLGDRCSVRLSSGTGTNLVIENDGGKLPTTPSENVATVAARYLLDAAGWTGRLEVRLSKGLPLGSGLGSSAASAASCLRAVIKAYEVDSHASRSPLLSEWVVAAGREGERVAAGSPHPDNVVPALQGGFRLMFDTESGLVNESLPVPGWLRVVVAIPELQVKTADARAVMPEVVPMADAVSNMARVGLMVSALYRSDPIALSLAIKDRLHQPYREPLIRGYPYARELALKHNAIAVGISGSGPAVFAFTTEQAASIVGDAMVRGFARAGVSARFKWGAIQPARQTFLDTES